MKHIIICVVWAAIAGCSSDPTSDGDVRDGDVLNPDADSDVDTLVDADDPSDADDPIETDVDESDAEAEEEPPIYDPRLVVATSELVQPRNWQIQRAIIHAHSIYSHDACDDEPFIDGVRNEQCFWDLRQALCDTAQDAIFLTDHADLFAEHEFPDVLLYEKDDTLIERDGLPVANRMTCEDGHEVIIAAGSETGTMPIGLERHVGDTPEERHQAYDDVSPAGVEALQDAGALVFLQHTEEWDIKTILDLPIDGLEVYNLHFNLMDNMGPVLGLVLDLISNPERLPDPEIILIAVFQENEADLERWAYASAHRPTPVVLATDVHRNTFPTEAPDGERIDSYRRLLHWFSNHLLVPEGEVDDQILKQAIGQGRFYGAFEYLGVPDGFDFRGHQGETISEMGQPIDSSQGEVQLEISIPEVYGIEDSAHQPPRRAILLRAHEGTWEEVASTDTDLQTSVSPGIYRAEIRITPDHLEPYLGTGSELLGDLTAEKIWIYSNTIEVRE